jgi:ferredoxin-NADP reductase
MMFNNGTLNVRIARVEDVTPEIRRLTLVSPDGQHLPPFSGGSNIVLVLKKGEQTLRNAYSLMGSPYDSSVYQIAVRKVEDGRGGSRLVHETLREGDELQITAPVNLFPLDKHARLQLFIAGGVGITPVFSQLEELRVKDLPFEVHYAVRSSEHVGLGRELQARYGQAVHLYVNGEGPQLDIAQVLSKRPLGSHVYVCGPGRMIDDTINAAHRLGWTDSHIHYERFVEQGSSGEAFSVTLARAGVTVEVSPDQSMLEALEAAGHNPPYLCRGGACGHCETTVLELDGTIEHRDDWLSDEDKQANRKIMPCVSRACGNRLVVDL